MTASRLLSLRLLSVVCVLCSLMILSGCRRGVDDYDPYAIIPRYFEAHVAYVKIKKEQPSSIELKAELIEQIKDDSGKNIGKYQIIGNGLPNDTRMLFWSLYGGYLDPVRFEVITDSEGNLYRYTPEDPGRREPVIVSCDMLSSSCSYFFIQSDHPTKPLVAALRIVPSPVFSEGSDGAKIELFRIEKGANFVLVELTGFEPNERVHYVSRSCDETVRGAMTVDKKGKYNLLFFPPVIGRIQGDSKLTVYSDNNKLTINYYWTQKDWTIQDETMFKNTLLIIARVGK